MFDTRTAFSFIWDSIGGVCPVKVTVDNAGRVLLPKALRDELGLAPGSTVDLSRFGAGLALFPGSRTARLVQQDGVPVVTGETTIDDDTVFGLVDAGRR